MYLQENTGKDFIQIRNPENLAAKISAAFKCNLLTFYSIPFFQVQLL